MIAIGGMDHIAGLDLAVLGVNNIGRAILYLQHSAVFIEGRACCLGGLS